MNAFLSDLRSKLAFRARGGVETRMSRDSHVSQVGILIMSRLISYEIRYTWNQFLVEFLENCMSRFILSPKNYSVVLRSTQRIFRFVKKLKGCKKGCKLREFLFLVRNTLQRVLKIHCNYSLSLWKRFIEVIHQIKEVECTAVRRSAESWLLSLLVADKDWILSGLIQRSVLCNRCISKGRVPPHQLSCVSSARTHRRSDSWVHIDSLIHWHLSPVRVARDLESVQTAL